MGRLLFLYGVLGLLLLISTFILGEIAVRTLQYFGATTFPFRQFDAELGVSLIPGVSGEHRKCYDGFVSINQYGMRDKERTLVKPDGVFRIGVFSDSLIEAVHVKPEQTSTSILEDKLNTEICNGKCEVLNFSVGGYSTLQNYLRYMRDGKRFNLDLAVLVFTDNDLPVISEQAAFEDKQSSEPGENKDQLHVVGNLYPSPALQKKGSEQVIVFPHEPPYTKLLTYAFRHSSLLYFLYKAYNIYIRAPHVWAINDLAPSWAKSRPSALFLDPENPIAKRGWEQTEWVLDQFVLQTRSEHTDFWIVYWGYDEGSNPWYEPLPDIKELPHSFDPAYASKWFINYGKKKGIPVYNLGADLAEYVRSNKLEKPYLSFSCDMHLNPKGQSVVAELLYSQLKARNLIKLTSETHN